MGRRFFYYAFLLTDSVCQYRKTSNVSPAMVRVSPAMVRVSTHHSFKFLPTDLLEKKSFFHLIHNIWLKNICTHMDA